METPEWFWSERLFSIKELGLHNQPGTLTRDDLKDHSCQGCGEMIWNSDSFWVRVVDGGGLIVAPSSEYDEDPSAELGCWAVCRTCAPKFNGLAEPFNAVFEREEA